MNINNNSLSNVCLWKALQHGGAAIPPSVTGLRSLRRMAHTEIQQMAKYIYLHMNIILGLKLNSYGSGLDARLSDLFSSANLRISIDDQVSLKMAQNSLKSVEN